MSFLLRNNRRSTNNGGAGGRIRHVPTTGASSDRRIIPQPRSSLIRGQHQSQQLLQRQSKHGALSGNQILVERTVQQQQQRLQTKSSMATKQAESQNQRQNTTGVITMSEVLEDLRVLEQQQKEAQRKLANARVTKDHRLQQCTALESKLEKMKYTNGELRAQLREHREFLSCGTRELGTCRLAGGRAGDDIRDFEKKLKRGLHSSRMIIAIRRKIDSAIIAVQNKEAVLNRLKTETREKLKMLDKELEAARSNEQSLRSSIQEAVSKAQKYADDLYLIRAENAKLEQEMLSSQSAEESTKLKAEAIDVEIDCESKRHKEVMSELKHQLDAYKKQEKDIAAEEEALSAAFEEKSRQLISEKRRIVDLQQLEGLSPGLVSANFQDPIPTFDRTNLKAMLEIEESKIRSKMSENEALKETVAKLRAEITKTQQETKTNLAQASSLLDCCRNKEAIERDRRQQMESFQKELELEREEVEKLEKASSDLQNERDQEASTHENIISEYKEAINNDQAATVIVEKEIEIEAAAIKEIASSWEKEKVEYCARLEEASARAFHSEKAVEDLDSTMARLKEDRERSLQQQMEEIEAEMISLSERTKGQITRLIQRYPQLQAVDFSYDSTKTHDEQIESALEGLVTELEASVRVARKAKDARKAKQKDARRKAEAAAAEVKRKEEDRRKNRERLQAKIKRKEDEERHLEEARRLQEEEEKQQRDQAAKVQKRARKSKGADFFFPQSHGGSLDDETPANPKRLLPRFDNIGEESSQSKLSSTQNSDKRVRWKDDGDEETVVDQPEAPLQEIAKVALPNKKRQYGRGTDSTTNSKSKSSTKRSSDSVHGANFSPMVNPVDKATGTVSQNCDGTASRTRKRGEKVASKKGVKGVIQDQAKPEPQMTLSQKARKKQVIPSDEKKKAHVAGGDSEQEAQGDDSLTNLPSYVARIKKSSTRNTSLSPHHEKDRDTASETGLRKVKGHKKQQNEGNESVTGRKKVSDKPRHSKHHVTSKSNESTSSRKLETKRQHEKQEKGSKKSKSIGNLLQPLGLSKAQTTSSVLKRKDPVPSTSRPNGTKSKSSKSSSNRSRKSDVGTKKANGSRKRKSVDIPPSTQTSGLSSSERGPKSRRRKKKETSATKQKVSNLLRDDAYDFHF